MANDDSSVNPFSYLQRNADERPNGVFSKSLGQTMTYAEAVVSAKQIAYELRRLGVKAGQVVALDLPDQLAILFTEALYHEAAIGAVLPPGYIAEGFTIDWIFTSREPAPQPGATIVEVDTKFIQLLEQNPYGISPSTEPLDIMRLAFSSGTTGNPNAIPLTRAALQAFDDGMDTWFGGDPFLVLMDFGTPWGFGGFYLSVKAGRPYLSVGGADQEQIVRMIVDNNVTSLKGSPAQLAALVDTLEAQNVTLTTVESIWFGGTIMPPGVADRLRRATGGAAIHGMYGSTEAAIATTRLYESEDPSNAGAIIPGSIVEIVDDADQPVPVGTQGNVRHRSGSMVTEYLGNPEASARAFRDGWFYSGDLGLLRPDGGLTLTGRQSEVLNAGGVKIDPNKVDLFAVELPGVLDACTFEFTTASGLREIGIGLVTEDGIDVDAVVAALTAEFAFAAPKLVARITEVPRNTMGKPLRRTLAQRYQEG